MYIPRVSPAAATRTSPSATLLSDHGRLQRLLRGATARIADHLPGFRGRYSPDRLVDATDSIVPRQGRRRHLQDSPHLGRIVDLYV